MTWQWSHTAEAYKNVRENIEGQPREWLETVYAEWRAGSGDDFDLGAYYAALAEAKALPPDILADDIYDKAEEQALCLTGGWKAWACPYGCGPHLIPFDPPEEDGDEREMTDEWE